MTPARTHSILRELAASMLAVVIVAGSLFVWIGVPVLGMRIIVAITSRSGDVLLLAVCGIPLAMVVVGWLLYRVNRVYEELRGGAPEVPVGHGAWLKSLSDTRRRALRPRRLIDVSMTASAATALVLMVVWFFFFAQMRLITA